MKITRRALRKLIRETLQLNEMFIKGNADLTPPYNIVAFGSNIWKIGDKIDKRTVREILKATESFAADDDKDEYGVSTVNEFWSLAQFFDERGDVLLGEVDSDRVLALSSRLSFKFDPKSSILVKKTIKELDLSGVEQYDYGNDDEEEISLTSLYQIQGKTPSFAFHGTTSNYVSLILKKGISPHGSPTNYKEVDHQDLIFFATRLGKAKMHANHTARKVGGDPVVIVFKIPDPAKIIPDYDIDVLSSDQHYHNIEGREKQQQYSDKMKGKSSSLSREFGIYGYRGKILPQQFTKFFVRLNAEDQGFDGVEFSELDLDEMKTYLWTKEEFGYGNPNYEPDDNEDEEDW